MEDAIKEIMNIVMLLPAGLIFVILAIVMLAIAGIIRDLLTPYSIHEQLTGRDNTALGLSLTGYYLGIMIIYMGALYDPKPHMEIYAVDRLMSTPFLMDLLSVFGYSLGGILFLNLAHLMVDKLVLNRFSTKKEILEDRNVGTGAVEFGNYVASGLIIAGAISGKIDSELPIAQNWWFGIVTAVVFFFLGQIVFIIFGKFYQLITRYDIHAEIEGDNVSAGVAFGGNLIAIGIILFKGVSGNFYSWGENIGIFCLWAVLGFIILYVLRLMVDLFLLPRATLTHEISVDKNVNAAFLEGAVLIGIASIIFFAM